MISTPHNLANVPDWQLEEEQLTRALARGEKHITAMLESVAQMSRKQMARRMEIARQRARRNKEGGL